jgi:hypothetical protein
MKRWLRPSLLRRIVLTLLAALVLVWAVLSLKDYWVFKRDVHDSESVGRMTRTVLDSLKRFNEEQAWWALRAVDRQFNELRRHAEPQAPGALLFQLSRTDGTPIYHSDGAGPLPDLRPSASLRQVDHLGMGYWPVVQEDARWRLAVWVPVMSDGTALALIGADVLGYVLLALPFVLLPMVLAVWQGLRRCGADAADRPTLARRSVALHEPTGYAELAPLVDASNALLAGPPPAGG